MSRRPQPKKKETQPDRRFPVVGIGASAGGLEAFTQFLEHLPLDTGMAFVLVQHLDPTHESILTDLLSKSTKLPVREVRNNMRLEPDHVYVIPPGTVMTVRGGVLKLAMGKPGKGVRHGIDFFLESLAEDQGPQAIGVVLSGSASDGTLGLEAIKNEGGITLAQDASAKFDSMPRSAIASGCVDLVLGPAEIAAELARIARYPRLLSLNFEEPAAAPAERGPYQRVLQLLRLATGTDFTLYKTPTLQRRVARRMVLNKAPDLAAYGAYLRNHKEELEALYQDVLINVTSFFRNPETFELLKQRFFPGVIKNRTPDQPVRMWVPGCSTGQEAYSLAMVFLEFAARASSQIPLQIFATDLNEHLLDRARTGLYSKSQVQDLSQDRRRRFFVEEEGGFRICKPIRELCIFARHDVLSDPPFSKVDLVSCRNLLIYLDPAVQKRLMPMFYYALKPRGFLLLGNSESTGGFSDLFAVEDKAHKLYSRKEGVSRLSVNFQPKTPASPKENDQKVQTMELGMAGELEAQKEAHRLLLSRYSPAAVLLNEGLEALQFHGPISRFLELAPGRVNYKLLKMTREGLLLPIRKALQEAKRQNGPARVEKVEFRYDGGTRRVNLEVTPLKNGLSLLVFEPVGPDGEAPQQRLALSREALPPGLKEAHREVARLRQELAAAREHQQSATEQYEAANEELQAANEEGQSSNEELQSINEELETTKEELQSTNEELVTVNEEMGSRNLELHRTNSDLNNVLDGVQMCIVVLGGDLCIRRFTPLAEKILNLVATDVGRPITNIRPNFEFPDLERVIHQTIKSIRPTEQEVQDKEGRWYSLRVLPYKTLDHQIDGAVLVLVDIDELKHSEQRIQAALGYTESIIETIREPLLVLGENLQIERANRSFYNVFKLAPAEAQGRSLERIGGKNWNMPHLRALLQEVLAKGTSFDDFEMESDLEEIGRRTLLFTGRPIAAESGRAKRLLLAIEDVTERKQLAELRENEERFRTLAEALPQLVWTCLPDANCDYFNSKWTDYTGVPVADLLGIRWRETLHEEDRERTCDFWWAALRGQVPYDLEYRIRRADGVYHWFKARATPLRDPAGNIIKWFGTCTDIDDQKRIQRELQQGREELELRVKERTEELHDMMQELESFSYSVSHDLRSPLRAMLGFAELALERGGGQMRPEVQDFIRRIISSATRADRLVQDILAYSRVSRAHMRLAPVDLETILRDTILQYPSFQAPQAEIQIHRPLLPVQAHETFLAQCISNILANAIKFVLPGTVPRVKIWTEEKAGQVRIWLKDNGIGIEPANLTRIFSIFERVHSMQEYEGTGIGLAIVRKNIERMGGTVGVESEPGVGSQFWIQLQGMNGNEQTDLAGRG
jgi:two-component system CheB/CheR fusion protein